ncbi:zinc ribbon domain-containing protein [Ruminococcaceae bacterium OttesenSCG-928-O06]|nr:zinc ribbon domain-containing protein [Ruminococcaceae bacterium OttesenSCG-928-O06]
MVKCPECEKEVSDKAPSCPNCGYEVRKHIDLINQMTESGYYDIRDKMNSIENDETLTDEQKEKEMFDFLSSLDSDTFYNYTLFSAKENGQDTSEMENAHKETLEAEKELKRVQQLIQQGRYDEIDDYINENAASPPVPRCPTCQSTNVKKISGASRAGSVGILGIFSKKINKSFECGSCGYTW